MLLPHFRTALYSTSLHRTFRVPLFCATIPFWIQLGLRIILHSYLWCLPKDSVRTLQSSSRLQPTLLAIVIEDHCTAFV